MIRSFSIIIVVLIAAPLFGIIGEDSLWIHIKSVAEHSEGGKWRAINASWQVFVKKFDSESNVYSDWRECVTEDSLKISYIVQCAADSTFENVMTAGTTDARSYTFSGIPQKNGYYIRILTDNSKNPFRWDFAASGVQKKSAKQASERKEFYTMLGISIFIMLLGICSIVAVVIIKKKKSRWNNDSRVTDDIIERDI